VPFTIVVPRGTAGPSRFEVTRSAGKYVPGLETLRSPEPSPFIVLLRFFPCMPSAVLLAPCAAQRFCAGDPLCLSIQVCIVFQVLFSCMC
jgi:hypothetical protein